MANLWQTLETAMWNITHRIGVVDVLDMLIVAVVIYGLLMLTRQTQGSAVLKGVLLLGAVTVLSSVIGLTALNWIMMSIINNGALVLIILFQPELRKALESLGRGRLFRHGRTDLAERNRVISELVQCMTDLSRRRVGALIVLERKTGVEDIVETGTEIDARISAPLLENIFEPNTPLHDGAVIIRDMRVVAGACILPLTESRSVSRELGTRHRAALGISETTDAVALIVSEETGTISMARDGRLTRHLTAETLKEYLEELFAEPITGLGLLKRLRAPRKEKDA